MPRRPGPGRARRQSINDQKQAARHNSLLLLEVVRKDCCWDISPVGDDVWICWNARNAHGFESLAAPWNRLTPIPLPESATPPQHFAISGDVAVTTTPDHWHVHSHCQATPIPSIVRRLVHLGGTGLPNHFLFMTPAEIGLLNICTAAIIHRADRNGRHGIVLHPSGAWALTRSALLELWDLQKSTWHEWPPGGQIRVKLAPSATPIDPDDFTHAIALARERIIAKLERTSASPGEIESALGKFDADARGMRDQLEETQINHAAEFGAESATHVGFTHDGQHAWCGTEMGLRVWRSDDLLHARGNDLPDPLFNCRIIGTGSPPAGTVTAAINTPDGRAILFATVAGDIHRLDLHTGTTHRLLRLPEGAATTLVLDRAQQVLVTVADIARFQEQGQRDYRSILQVWNFPKLL